MKTHRLFHIQIFCLLVLMFTSCEDTFQYNPNEVVLHDDEKHVNAKNIEKITSIPFSDTLRFIVISDVHHDYENFEDFVAVANNMHDIAFVAVTGDLTSFGLQTEYREYHDIMKNLHLPIVSVIGNHDLLGNGEKVYHEMFGDLNFTFTCNGNKFICMDSNSREYDFNGQVPDLAWLNHELSESGFTHTFVLSHIAPFDNDFDPALENGYVTSLAGSMNARLSFHGHSHEFYQEEHYGDGVLYMITDDIKDRAYTLVTVWSDGYVLTQNNF